MSVERDNPKVKLGFGSQMNEVELKRMSKKDIPPYQPEDKLAIIGSRTNRYDAVAKVTGRAKYTYDQNLKGMTFGKIVRAPHANAVIKSIDLSAAKAMPGVVAVISYEEIFAKKSVMFAWDGVAAVAAETEAQAEAAAKAVKVEYEPLPFAVTVEASMKDGAPKVGRGNDSNVVAGGRRQQNQKELEERKKAIDEIFANADVKTAEGTFETPVQIHHSLETHGHVCEWQGDDLTVYASTQATFGTKGDMMGHDAVKPKNVRVLAEYIGGGFGSKFSAEAEGIACAVLAKVAQRPVKLMLDRREESTDGGNRPDSIQKMGMAVNPDGTIAATRITNWGTAGPGGGGAGATNAVMYNLGNVFRQEYTVRTNCGEARAMRAPGWPQGVFGLESLMDMAAHAAGLDPLEFRKKNDPHPIRQAEYEVGAKAIGWAEKRQKVPGSTAGPVKTGVGMACGQWPNTGNPGSRVRVRILKNGTVEVRNGCQDIGTGTKTILGMCAAEELGLTLADVTVFMGDTNDPEGPGSGGSTTAPSVTPAARLAGYRAKEALLALAAAKIGVPAAELNLVGGRVVRKDGKNLDKGMTFKEACALIVDDSIDVIEARQQNFEGYQNSVGGVQFAEVEVDVELGVVRVKKVVAVADCGKVINHKTAESQVSGGVIQGVSFALHERRIMDRHKGHMINADMEMYKISGPVDCPEIEVLFMDVYNGVNNTNVVGLGEPPNIATAAAIANAIYNATGLRMTSLPITPKKILTAMAEKEAGKK